MAFSRVWRSACTPPQSTASAPSAPSNAGTTPAPGRVPNRSSHSRASR